MVHSVLTPYCCSLGSAAPFPIYKDLSSTVLSTAQNQVNILFYLIMYFELHFPLSTTQVAKGVKAFYLASENLKQERKG